MCYNEYWGSVCGYGTIDTIADVACRELHYAAAGNVLLETQHFATGFFPIVPTVWNSVVCTGSENTLLDCIITPAVDEYPVCDHDQEITISCTGG